MGKEGKVSIKDKIVNFMGPRSARWVGLYPPPGVANGPLLQSYTYEVDGLSKEELEKLTNDKTSGS